MRIQHRNKKQLKLHNIKMDGKLWNQKIQIGVMQPSQITVPGGSLNGYALPYEGRSYVRIVVTKISLH